MTANRKTMNTKAIRENIILRQSRCPIVKEPDPICCPYCLSIKPHLITGTKVTDPPNRQVVKRYRQCQSCGRTFCTIPPQVVIRDEDWPI